MSPDSPSVCGFDASALKVTTVVLCVTEIVGVTVMVENDVTVIVKAFVISDVTVDIKVDFDVIVTSSATSIATYEIITVNVLIGIIHAILKIPSLSKHPNKFILQK